MLFYIAVAILLLLSAAVVMVSLKRHAPDVHQLQQQRIQRYVAMFKLRQLKHRTELEQGLIDQADFDLLYAEQARELIEQVSLLSAASTKAEMPKKPWFVLALLLPLLALMIYWRIGAYADWQISQSMQALAQVESAEQYQQQLSDIVERVQKRLLDRPDAIDYRLFLAQLAMADSQFAQALSHYSVVAELLPDDAQAQAFYAQALYLSANRVLTADVASAMDRTLQLDPLQPTMLGMQGIIAYEQQDFTQALDAWQKLLPLLAPNSQRAQMIQRGIDEAKAQLAGSASLMAQPPVKPLTDATSETQPIPAKQPAQTLEPASDSLRVTVEISDQLRQQYAADTVVFIFARAVDGPPMPLAAKRFLLSELPATVVLDTEAAMMPQFTLQQFDQVTVSMRISPSGNPVQQPGDPSTQSEAFNWRQNPNQQLRLP